MGPRGSREEWAPEGVGKDGSQREQGRMGPRGSREGWVPEGVGKDGSQRE